MTASEIVIRRDSSPQHIGGDSPVLVSSAARGWSDIVVEHQRLQAADLSGYLEGHLVSLQLAPPPELRLSVDGHQQAVQLRAGDVLLLPAGVQTATAWDAPSEVINVMLRAQGLPAGGLAPGIVRDPVIASLCLALVEHLRQPVRSTDAIFAQSMRDAITARLHSDVDPAGAAFRTAGPRLTRADLAQVDKLINASLADDLSVQDLARTVAMSQAHFSRAFRATTGQTPHAHLTARRVQEAKRLLRTRPTTLDQVAHHVGFVDGSHLARHFRHLEGITPTAYRTIATK